MNQDRLLRRIRQQRLQKKLTAFTLSGVAFFLFNCSLGSSSSELQIDSASHISIAPIFSDHVVLQRRQKLPIWGMADPNSGTVRVSINGRTALATVDAAGRWRATLPPLEAGGPYDLTVSSIVIHDVLIGDVFLASGQSNMAYTLSQETNAPAPTPDASIRFCFERIGKHDPPGTAAHLNWESQQPLDPRASAVAYYFADAVRQRTHVPIGIIQAADGGTNGQAWTSTDALKNSPQLLEDAWTQERLSKGSDRLAPATRFNTMILPIVPFAISDVLWYQGEQNTSLNPQHYRELLTVLIQDWRRRWGYDVPFYIVQLHNVGTSQDANAMGGFAQIREAQQKVTQELPTTYLVVTIDTGDGEMHPPDKWDVGRRLAVSVLDHRGGPTFDRAISEGNRLRIFFKGATNGLRPTDAPLNGFWIAGVDRHFVAAKARIVGTNVIVYNTSIAAPAAVRYAWSENPQGLNLIDGSGLPAAPFRTDDW